MVSRTRIAGLLGFGLLLGISGAATAIQEDSSPGESPRVMRTRGKREPSAVRAGAEEGGARTNQVPGFLGSLDRAKLAAARREE